MDETTVSENMQEVALPADTETSTETVETQTEETVSEVQPKRDFEKDANFARIRREKEAAQKEIERLKSAMKSLNFKGENVSEIADEAESLHTGKTVEEVRAERERLERLDRLEAENKELKARETEHFFEKDLEALKTAYPELKVKTVFEIGGGEFAKLRAAGVDTITAYEAIRAKEARETKPKPPSTGSVKSNSVPESEYFTSEQLDRLTPKQLDDPQIYKKAMASLAKLKK